MVLPPPPLKLGVFETSSDGCRAVGGAMFRAWTLLMTVFMWIAAGCRALGSLGGAAHAFFEEVLSAGSRKNLRGLVTCGMIPILVWGTMPQGLAQGRVILDEDIGLADLVDPGLVPTNATEVRLTYGVDGSPQLAVTAAIDPVTITFIVSLIAGLAAGGLIYYLTSDPSVNKFKDKILSSAHLEVPGNYVASSGAYSPHTFGTPNTTTYVGISDTQYRAIDGDALQTRGNHDQTVLDCRWVWYHVENEEWGNATHENSDNEVHDKSEDSFWGGWYYKALHTYIDQSYDDFTFTHGDPPDGCKYALQVVTAHSFRKRAVQFDLVQDFFTMDRSLREGGASVDMMAYLSGRDFSSFCNLYEEIVGEEVPFSFRLAVDGPILSLSGDDWLHVLGLISRGEDHHIVWQLDHLDRVRNKYADVLFDLAKEANAGYHTWLTYEKASKVWVKTSSSTGHWEPLEWEPGEEKGWLLAHTVDKDEYDLLDDNEVIRGEEVSGGYRLFWGDEKRTENISIEFLDNDGNTTTDSINHSQYKGLRYANYGFEWWDKDKGKYVSGPSR